MGLVGIRLSFGGFDDLGTSWLGWLCDFGLVVFILLSSCLPAKFTELSISAFVLNSGLVLRRFAVFRLTAVRILDAVGSFVIFLILVFGFSGFGV